MPRTLVAALLVSLFSACGGGGGGASAEPSVAASPAPTPLPAGWTRLADLPAGAAKFGLTALGGKLYLAGGYDTRSAVIVYDIASNTWSATNPMPRGSDNLVAMAVGSRIYAVGGEASTSLQVFEPASARWTAGPALPGPRFASAGAVVGERLFLAGGWNVSNSASASLASQDAFDIATQTWSATAAMPTPRNAAGAAVIDGKVHVVGGRSPGIRATDQTSLATLEVYDPATNTWVAGTPLPTARASLAVVALGGRLYSMGGEAARGVVSDAVERYDPVTRAWTALPAMPYRSHGLGAAVVGDSIYVLGGFTGASDAVGTESVAVYRYTP
jgi:N-acetylneuraminic acid mutarotase